MSPKCRSCSGRRFRLPGEPVVIEKLTVVGEMFPADDTDLSAMWLYRDAGFGIPLGPVSRPNTIVGDPAGDEPECIDAPPNESGMSPSSCMSIDMFDGSEANNEDDALTRRRLDGPAMSYGASGACEADSGEPRASAYGAWSPRGRSEFVRECDRLRRSDDGLAYRDEYTDRDGGMAGGDGE